MSLTAVLQDVIILNQSHHHVLLLSLSYLMEVVPRGHRLLVDWTSSLEHKEHRCPHGYCLAGRDPGLLSTFISEGAGEFFGRFPISPNVLFFSEL